MGLIGIHPEADETWLTDSNPIYTVKSPRGVTFEKSYDLFSEFVNALISEN